MSFDERAEMIVARMEKCLNPFRSGQCLSTDLQCYVVLKGDLSQSLSIRAMSFDRSLLGTSVTATSQSLSIRAMSFDRWRPRYGSRYNEVSIPFDQGNVFRLIMFGLGQAVRSVSQSLSIRAMSFDNEN